MTWIAVTTPCRATEPEGESASVDFRQQIQPLLARHCLACHGPDANTREADLRLDVESAAKQHAIVAGDAASSELVSRIDSTDAEVQMPPPETGHHLSEEERTLIRRWVNEGANWQSHWAFAPIVATESPPILDGNEASPIDRFVEARRFAAGLKKSAPANRATLLRRVSMDLIGLPPSPEQVTRFVNDDRPNAFELVVDELFQSPHYGEQMAVDWLDVARYADTNGYQNDFNRSMWPWRDWVIDAFQTNLPYDQFIVQQMAGDILPGDPDSLATQKQIIATGFHRNNRSVTEGGSIEAEWQVENCVDRVETTAGAFLGLTMGCARCHDHKYDPISQKEFYQFYAFFNNVDERGVYNEARGNVGPQLTVATKEQTARLTKLSDQIAEQEAKVSSVAFSETIESWRDESTTPARYRFDAPAKELPRGDSPVGESHRLDGQSNAVGDLPQPDFKIERDTPFSWSVWVHGDARGALFAKMDVGNAYRGIDGLVLGNGQLKIHLIHQWPGNAIAVLSKTNLPRGQWTCVTVTYDGTSQANGVRIYLDGKAVETQIERDQLTGTLNTGVPFRIGQRSTAEFLTGELARFQLFDVELTAEQVAGHVHHSVVQYHDQLVRDSLSLDASHPVVRYISQLHDSPAAQELKQLRDEYEKQLAARQTTMVMRDRPEYRETFLLQRGQYDLPDTREALWPAIPGTLPPLTADQPANRLGLAQWMVDDRNPLVARVAVNRVWQKFFGRGLVDSVDNFGVQGDPPSHPLLLDYLADDFRRHGWNLQRLQKQIVLSATYQQSSEFTTETLAKDPGNRWLARGPRYRLSAEQVRDQALAVSGLLTDRVGGPSVYPYQPDGLWEELAGGASGGPYKLSTGNDLYRRSLYTFRKRTVSHPTLATLDAPSWEICQLKRSRTNTPLQALALLNDTTYVEAARNLAQRMLTEPSDPQTDPIESAIRHGFRTATLRDPTTSELETLHNGYVSRLEHYQSHPEDAKSLCDIGDSSWDESLSPPQLAAMTSVAAILFNLDEVLTKE